MEICTQQTIKIENDFAKKQTISSITLNNKKLNKEAVINMLSLSERLVLAEKLSAFNEPSALECIDDIFEQSPFNDAYLYKKWAEKNTLTKKKLRRLHSSDWLTISAALEQIKQPALTYDSYNEHHTVIANSLNELSFLSFEINAALWRTEFQLKNILNEFNSHVYVPEQLISAFFPQLTDRLSIVCTKAVRFLQQNAVSLSLTDEAYRERVIKQFPALWRQCSKVIKFWRNYVCEFASHLLKDLGEIQTTLGKKSLLGKFDSITGILGDSHNQGRFTFICQFSCGLKIAYKPRDLALEHQFYQFINFLSAKTRMPQLYQPKFLLRNDYGWMEYIDAKPCSHVKQVSDYYYRSGCLLSILYLLEAEDIHFENVIARQDCPVVIDLESLFHLRDDSIKIKKSNAIEHTVLKTHFIPQFESTNIEDDVAAIISVADKNSQLDRTSLPLLFNERIPVNDYSTEFVEGFKFGYQQILSLASEIPEQLKHFAGLTARYIPRTTGAYSRLWQSSCQPYYQQSGIKLELCYEKLWLDTKKRPHLSKLINEEKLCLSNSDIPYFQHKVGSKDVFSGGKSCCKGYFAQDSLALVKEKLAYLSEEDCSAQIKIIERSLKLVQKNKTSFIKNNLPPQDDSSSANWLAQSKIIADTVLAKASISKHSIFWPVSKYHPSGVSCLDGSNYSLHDGVLGILHFLAYYNQFSNNSIDSLVLKQSATQVFDSLLGEKFLEEGCGAFEGLGGIIYSLSHLIHLWGDDNLKYFGEHFINELSHHCHINKNFDVMSGSAGAILALLSYFQVTQSNQTLAIAVSFADHLVESFQVLEHCCGWITADGKILTGFAHGNAGISYALLKLYQLIPNDRYRIIANQAMVFEHSSYCRETGNWLDLRFSSVVDQKKQAMTAWCNGAMGIGYSRLLLKQDNLLHQDMFKLDIQRAKKSTLLNTELKNHGLCHGHFGNHEFIQQLILAGFCSELESKKFIHNINKLLVEINAEGLMKSNKKFEDLGLMNGLSGIGYQLLRFTQPDRIPSVLMLAPPIK